MSTQNSPSASALYRLYPWIICALGAVFYTYEYYLRIAPSVMVHDLMSVYHLTAGLFGNLTAYYYYIYTPMQFFVGLLMDRYGPRRLLTLACLCCAVGAYLFAATPYLAVAEVGRFLIGFGSAFAFVGALKLATIWLPPERFALISGSVTTLGMLGAILGNVSLTWMVEMIGWRTTTFISAFFGILLAISIVFVVRDQQKDGSRRYHNFQPINFIDLLKGLLVAMSKPQMWLIGLIGCLLYLPLSGFAELWCVPYLTQAKHFSPKDAAFAVSMIFLGWAVGGPLMGWMSDSIKRRRMPIVLASAAAAILISIVIYWDGLGEAGTFALLFIFGVVNGVQVLVFPLARETNNQRIAGTALSVTNMLVMIGGVIFQPLIGHLLDLGWDGSMLAGVRVFNAHDFKVALCILPCAMLGSVIGGLLLKETYCQVKE